MKESKPGNSPFACFIRRACTRADVRVGPALITLLLLAPSALAQTPAPSADIRALVRLAGPQDDVLHVSLVDAAGPSAYDVKILRPVADFVIVRASDVLRSNVTVVDLAAPDGWGATSSESYLVFARDLRVSALSASDSRVRLATQGPSSSDDRGYLARGGAYLSAQHVAAPDDLLVVRAPRDLVANATGANDTLLLPFDASLDDLARGFVRLHQRYRVVEVAPTSGAWMREGEERVQVQMSLLAAGARTAAQVQDAFTTARAIADPDQRLPQAPGGSVIARQKGLIVVRALDAELRNVSGGRVGLADLLGRLETTTTRQDSFAIQQIAQEIAGTAMAPFFDRFVYGSEWPASPPVRDGADVWVTALDLAPARAKPGEQAVATYSLVNRGTQPAQLDLPLAMDGGTIQTLPVRLDVGASAQGTALVVSSVAGDHTISLGSKETLLHVLSRARVTIERASATPEEPRAREPFTLLVYVRNAGEQPATLRIEVRDGEKLLQRTTPLQVAGLANDATTLPMRLDEPGLHVLAITLVGDDANDTREHQVSVQLSGADRPTPLSPWVLVLALLVGASRRLRHGRIATL